MFNSFGYSSPIEFMFGVGRSRDVGDRLRSRNYSRIMIVTDPGIVESGIVEAVEAPLRADGFEIELFAEVKSNPTVENVDAGAEALLASGAEVIVGLGGGSPIDTAKIISAVAANGCSAHDLMTGSRQIEIPGVPQIAIPTTAGSGAESSKVSVLVDHETGEKKGVFGTGTAPWITVLDPELMTGMPPWLTAATGIDALSHALEAYLGLGANPFSDALAEQGMRLVARHLERAVFDGLDIEARSAMTIASALGGLAKEQSGLGILHAIAMPLGYHYDLHHGYLCAALMPATLDFNRSATLEKTAWVGRAFGVDGDDETVAGLAGQTIRELNARIGLGMGLREAGVQERDFAQVAEEAMQSYLMRNNPIEGTPEACFAVLEASL